MPVPELANAPDQLLNAAFWLFGSALKIIIALLLVRTTLEVITGGIRGLFRRSKRRSRKTR